MRRENTSSTAQEYTFPPAGGLGDVGAPQPVRGVDDEPTDIAWTSVIVAVNAASATARCDGGRSARS